MPVYDTSSAFYQWDSVPYSAGVQVPDMGMAADSTYSLYYVPDMSVVHDTMTRVSLFVGHALSTQHAGLIERGAAGVPVWVFVVMLALVSLTTLYFRQRKLRLRDLLVSLFDIRLMDRMLRNSNMVRTVALVPAGLLVTACLAVPVHQLAMNKTGIIGYLLLTAALMALYLVRNGIVKLLATVFDDQHAVSMYITSNYLYHLVLTILILPLLFLQTYLPHGGEVVLWIMAGIVVLEFLIRVIRGMNIILTYSSCSHFYLFYYLCTVEIVPILVLVKWFVG